MHAVVEREGVEVETARARELGQRAERVGQRRRVRVGVDEHERAPRVHARAAQAELAAVEAGSASERGAARSEPSSPYVHAW